MSHAAASTTRTRVARTPAVVIDASGTQRTTRERVAGEEPLEIRLAHAGEVLTTTATRRTPGSDFALAAGLLLAEGVITSRDDIAAIRYCTDPDVDQQYNVVTVDLAGPPRRTLGERTLMATASCGVCGAAEIDEACARITPIPTESGPLLAADILVSLPDFLQVAQRVFAETGGLHAAGLFDTAGRLIALHEDIGRHNALDKLIGEQLLAGGLPALGERVIVLSGRISFELVQKAAAAGAPVLAAVGAPSNLAVATADRLGLTLAGWVRDGRATLYTHAHRIGGTGAGAATVGEPQADRPAADPAPTGGSGPHRRPADQPTPTATDTADQPTPTATADTDQPAAARPTASATAAAAIAATPNATVR